jgi:hypothetical protein
VTQEQFEQQLLDAAEKATPGQWRSDGDDCDTEQDDPYIYVDIPKLDRGISVLFNADWGTTEDARYIELAQPTNIKSLILEHRKQLANARKEALEEAANYLDSGTWINPARAIRALIAKETPK